MASRSTHLASGQSILTLKLKWILEPGQRPRLRPLLGVPLLRDDVVLGVLSLSGERGGFSDSQIELLKTFAEQAVIAITSAETYRALQQPLETRRRPATC